MNPNEPYDREIDALKRRYSELRRQSDQNQQAGRAGDELKRLAAQIEALEGKQDAARSRDRPTLASNLEIKGRSGASSARTAAIVMLSQVFLGLTTTIVAITDIASSFTFVVWLRGLILCLTGITILVGGIAVIVMHRYRSIVAWQSAIVGSLLSLILSFTTVVLQLRSGLYLTRELMWIPVATLSGWCFFKIVQALGHSKVPMPNVRKLAAAITVSSVVSTVNLVYTNVAQPPPPSVHSLNLTAQFGKPARIPHSDWINLPITIRIKNSSDAWVYVVGSAYSLTERKISVGDHLETPREMRNAILRGEPATPFSYRSGSRILQFDSILQPTLLLEPEEERIESRVVMLPLRGLQGVLHLEANVLVVRSEKVRLDPRTYEPSWFGSNGSSEIVPSWVAPEDADFILSTYRLDESGTVQLLTRPPKLLYVWWVLGGGRSGRMEVPYLVAAVAWEGREPKQPRLNRPGESPDELRGRAAVSEIPVSELQREITGKAL